MVDKTQNFLSLRVREDTKKRAEEELYRIWKERGKKITQDELVNLAFDALGSPRREHLPASYARENHTAHDLLEFILNDNREAAEWILGNLKMFDEAIRSRQRAAAGPRRQRRAM